VSAPGPGMVAVRAYFAASKRRQRAEAIARGDCARCTRWPATAGVYCLSCYNFQADYRRHRRQKRTPTK